MASTSGPDGGVCTQAAARVVCRGRPNPCSPSLRAHLRLRDPEEVHPEGDPEVLQPNRVSSSHKASSSSQGLLHTLYTDDVKGFHVPTPHTGHHKAEAHLIRGSQASLG